MSNKSDKLTFQATWSMAVGGMVGGGIFSTLGVVIGIAGPYAWLSFLCAGFIALISGYSYTRLAQKYKEGGGAFTFLLKLDLKHLAGASSWVLIVGYILTNAVYAFTFGEYFAHVFDLGPWFARTSAVGILVIFIALNLRGAGEAGGVEIFLVWFKLIVLLGLAAFGLAQWEPVKLSQGVPDGSIALAVFGAASVFMAYEGFQLLAYDYGEIKSPEKNLPRATISSILIVIVVYIMVTLGVTMLVGADRVLAEKEVALSLAGREALGYSGLVIVTIAAAFSTGSAINSTLFATARLMQTVSKGGQLPRLFDHKNSNNSPDRAILLLGLSSAILVVVGTLNSLVEAASLSFLITFTIVNGLACYQSAGIRFISGLGTIASASATVVLSYRIYENNFASLSIFVFLILVAIFLRPWLLSKISTE